jgi:hypothetical protein
VTRTTSPAKTEDIPVRAPALRLTAEREKDPLTG